MVLRRRLDRITFAGLACWAALLTPLMGRAETSEPVFEARLTSSSGTMTLTTADGKGQGTPPIYNPFALEAGDYIRTGSSSTVEIAFSGDTLIRMGPRSTLQLSRLSTGDIELFLKSGVLLAKVHFEKDKGHQFLVKTPSALITVRGTEFVVEESGTSAHIGVLDEGHVAVTAPGFKKEVVMHFNQETSVKRGLSPRNAQVLDKLYTYKIQMAEMRQRIGNISKHWKALTPDERERIRAEWIKANPAPAKPLRRARPIVQ